MTRFPAVGGGGEKPFMLEDRAETFGESDVTLTHDATSVSGESVGLATPETYSINNTTQYVNATATDWGISFTANREITSIDARADADYNNFTTATTAELRDNSGTVLDSVNLNNGEGSTFTFTPPEPLTPGNSYDLVAYDMDNAGFSSSDASPSDGPLLTIDGGYRNGEELSPALWDRIIPNGEILSGSVTVEWPAPTDIYRWDAGTFNVSPDGETVEVYIEESTDDGSTWTEIAGPVSRGEQIDADPDSRVRFRVELSRADTANNPTLDAIYRRWVV